MWGGGEGGGESVIKDTTKFKETLSEETFDILKGPLDVIPTKWYIFLSADNVSLNSVM